MCNSRQIVPERALPASPQAFLLSPQNGDAPRRFRPSWRHKACRGIRCARIHKQPSWYSGVPVEPKSSLLLTAPRHRPTRAFVIVTLFELLYNRY